MTCLNVYFHLATYVFNGLIDNLSIWSVALNSSDMKSLLFEIHPSDSMTDGKIPSNLVLFYDFNHLYKNNTILDNSVNKLHGTLKGGEKSTYVPSDTKPLYVTEFY